MFTDLFEFRMFSMSDAQYQSYLNQQKSKEDLEHALQEETEGEPKEENTKN